MHFFPNLLMIYDTLGPNLGRFSENLPILGHFEGLRKIEN